MKGKTITTVGIVIASLSLGFWLVATLTIWIWAGDSLQWTGRGLGAALLTPCLVPFLLIGTAIIVVGREISNSEKRRT